MEREKKGKKKKHMQKGMENLKPLDKARARSLAAQTPGRIDDIMFLIFRGGKVDQARTINAKRGKLC